MSGSLKRKVPQLSDSSDQGAGGSSLQHDGTGSPSDGPWPPTRYAWHAVILLGFANLFSFVDRFLLSLVVGPVKETFNISDTQVGLLQGLAFGIFYTLLGIPTGRLADRYSRRTIVGWGIAVWSLMTALFGLANTYTQLFLFRMGVGVGEATLNPCAVSLISDYFPEQRRSFALGVFTMSAFVGGGLAIILGGTLITYLESLGDWSIPVVGEIEAWQLAFICVGTPGLLLALLMSTVKEPKRRELLSSVPVGESIRFHVIWQLFKENRGAYGALNLGFSLIALDGYAKASWMPEYFVRTHGWSMAEVGLNYGFTYLVFAAAGALVGGWMGDFLKRRGYTDAPLRAAAIGAAISIPFSIFGPLVNNEFVSLALIGVAMFFSTFPYPLAASAISALAPNQMRAQAMAFYLLVVNIVGVGLGPTVTAVLTDYVFGDEAYLKYSLATVAAFTLPAALFLLKRGLPA